MYNERCLAAWLRFDPNVFLSSDCWNDVHGVNGREPKTLVDCIDPKAMAMPDCLSLENFHAIIAL